MCIKVYELDPAHFFVNGRKRNYGYGGICHAIHRQAKVNNKHTIYYDENKEISYILYLDANNQYGWVMSQKLPVNGFKWIRNVSKIDEDFIKNNDEDGVVYWLFS